MCAVPTNEGERSEQPTAEPNHIRNVRANKRNNKLKRPYITPFRYILANARSLTPKIESLLDYFDELDLHMAIVTESWLKPGKELEKNLRDLEDVKTARD